MLDTVQTHTQIIRPLERVPDTTVTIPGSKSLTNRALILAALADGESCLNGALDSQDTHVMIDSLRRLGFKVEGWNGSGLRGLQQPVCHGPSDGCSVRNSRHYAGDSRQTASVLRGDYTAHDVTVGGDHARRDRVRESHRQSRIHSACGTEVS